MEAVSRKKIRRKSRKRKSKRRVWKTRWKKLTGGEIERPTAIAVQAAMAIVCFVFVLLCVWSFIKARRASAAQRDS